MRVIKPRIFKIPEISLQIGKAENKVQRKKSREALDKIKITQLTRVREDVGKWRAALDRAESVLNPDRTELVRLFKDILLDAHLSSLIQTVEAKVLGSPFYIKNAEGEIDEEATALFRSKWFRDFARLVVLSRFYGFAGIQFGDIVGKAFESSKAIPYEYIIPEKGAIKKHLYVTTKDLIYFEDRPYNIWTMLVHEEGDLGILAKAAPLVLWKKNVLGAWSEAAELFGMPIRLGRTDINNPDAYANMAEMLTNMGSAAWGVFDLEDGVEFAQIAKTDYYQVYDKLIDRANSELSKLILGQTMTTDDGSSRSQAQVHERVQDDVIDGYKTYLADIVNDRLFPLMRTHKLIGDGLTYAHDNEEKIDIKSRFDMTDKLLKSNKYTIAPEWIEETFGIPVEEKEEPIEVLPQEGFIGEDEEIEEENPGPEEIENSLKGVKSVMPDVENLYKGVKKHKH